MKMKSWFKTFSNQNINPYSIKAKCSLPSQKITDAGSIFLHPKEIFGSWIPVGIKIWTTVSSTERNIYHLYMIKEELSYERNMYMYCEQQSYLQERQQSCHQATARVFLLLILAQWDWEIHDTRSCSPEERWRWPIKWKRVKYSKEIISCVFCQNSDSFPSLYGRKFLEFWQNAS